jgi:polysaccharide export outer membrane protein
MNNRLSCAGWSFVLIALLWLSQAVGFGQQQKKTDTQPAPAVTREPVEPGKTMTPSTGGGAPVDPLTYKIGPEDVLAVRVWREPELTGQYVVRPDGIITLPLIGEVKAGGVTPEALKQQIAESLSKFINRPEVMVSVMAVMSKKYYLVGEVLRPGMYPLVIPTTVLEALNGAGGFREFAKKSKITIVRGDKRIKFNYDDVIRGKNLSQNITVENGDHIIVP